MSRLFDIGWHDKMSKYLIVLFLIFCLKTVSCQRNSKKNCNGNESITTVSGTHAPKKVCSGDLIFDESFNKLDFKKWKHENTLAGGGNWEFQWYTNNRSNSYVKDGRLHIKPTLTSEVVEEDRLFNHTLNIHGYSPATYCTDYRWWGCERIGQKDKVLNPVRSAKLSTMNSFAFKYGKMKIRAKMPTGDWLRPAIWMLPLDDAYGPWPGSGTMVLAECRGNPVYMDDGVNVGVEQIEMNLHWGPDVTHDGYDYTRFTKQTAEGQGWDKAFHDYELEWTPGYIKFLIDGELISFIEPNPTFWELGKFDSTVKNNPYTSGTRMAPFDEEFFLIINLAVGGVHYWRDNGLNEKPWSNIAENAMTDFWTQRESWLKSWKLKEGDTAALQIEYIKIWAL